MQRDFAGPERLRKLLFCSSRKNRDILVSLLL